ncbi:MAG TPA: cytochrome c3 family protein [bacterium]
MKKATLVAVMLLAAGLMAMPAQVLALGGPHASFTCNNCHIPHAAGGDRLWIDVPSGTGNWGGNKIGQLCYSCHDGSTVAGVLCSNMGAYIYTGTTAHGPFFGAIPALPDGPAGTAESGETYMNANANLPYTAATNPLIQSGDQAIQCTSCHFVHDNTDGVSPYLRAGTGAAYRGDLCERCHRRGETDTAAEQGDGNSMVYTNATVSLHPVQISAVTATNGARLRTALVPSVAGAPGTPDIGNALTSATTAPTGWLLGAHSADGSTTGVLDCTTCHAVHGDETSQTPGQGNYKLAINNYPATYTSSPLCYGCHQLPVVTTASVGDHPIDTTTGTYVVTFPSDGGPNHGSAVSPWPQGTGTDPTPMCSSCHDAHGGMAANEGTAFTQGNDMRGRLRRQNPPLSPGLVNWCYSCHLNASPNNHHSHKGNLRIADGDDMDSVLDCENCHGGGAGTYAHNQAGGFFATANFGNGNHAASPTWCNYCHNVNPTDLEQPINRAIADTMTNIDGGNHNAGAQPVTPMGHGVDRGEGTHVLGQDGDFRFGAQSVVVTIPMAGAWPAPASNWASGSIDTVADNISRWKSAAAGDMVCESCHNIIGNIGYLAAGGTGKEGWQNNLLLMNYKDDGNGNRGMAAGSGAEVGAAFCMYCHYSATQGTTGPPGTHQITGQVITAAADNVRAITTLVTGSVDGTYADAAGAPNAASYPNNDMMDCDSCHRPHDSAPGGTASATSVDYATGVGGTITKGTDFILEAAEATAGVYSPALCVNCHNY